jgi:hypothetical protein
MSMLHLYVAPYTFLVMAWDDTFPELKNERR